MGSAMLGGRGSRRFSDAALAALVLAVVGMMILPLPTALLDMLIAGNVAAAVLMLLTTMYVRSGLEFASFPTVLLITTLYRLALNVSSTRLILLNADAGDVIRAFGEFVVGGNYVVGGVVFLVLTLIQFLVIAKGSERVAEVGARFTLDAMPGKQMSIDAELRSGGLSQDGARKRRAALQRESQFYGAMDGAMKFVKGDAIAGIVITLVNLVGGVAIGIGSHDLDAAESLRTFGLLTIGDGLVSQIPALLISTSAGLVVTRVASEDEGGTLGSDVASQVFGDPRALRIAGGFLCALALVPGLPAFPFLLLGGVLVVAGFGVHGRRAVAREETPRDPSSAVAPEGDARVPLLLPVGVELGPALAAELTLDTPQRAPLGSALERVRDELFVGLGLFVPPLRVRQRPELEPRALVVLVQEVPACALVLPELGREPLERQALAAITDAIARRAADLLGLQETQSMLDRLERAYPALVRNVVPKPVPLALLTDVLRRLVDEGISVRPLREILEVLAVHAPNERDPVELTELVRSGLRRAITHRYQREGVLHVHIVDPAVEEAVREAIRRTPSGSYLAMPPDEARDVIRAARALPLARDGAPLVLLCQADVRRFVRRLLEADLPDVAVLSYPELAPGVTIEPHGRLAL